MALLRVSIVTYNSQHIFEVLDKLIIEFKDNENIVFSIFDNGSSVEYCKQLEKYQTLADITFHSENKGFGYGHNHNLLSKKEPFFLVFNPDIILTQESLNIMLDYIENHSDVAMVSPKVLNEDGTTQYLVRERLSVFDFVLRFVPFSFIKKMFSKRMEVYECRNLSDTEIVPIRMGSGCFMLLRASDYKEINGFDERFFMYFEDNDLCMRLAKSGKKIMYVPTATVVHFYEKGAHKSKKLFGIFMKSMFQYFSKWGWTLF